MECWIWVLESYHTCPEIDHSLYILVARSAQHPYIVIMKLPAAVGQERWYAETAERSLLWTDSKPYELGLEHSTLDPNYYIVLSTYLTGSGGGGGTHLGWQFRDLNSFSLCKRTIQ